MAVIKMSDQIWAEVYAHMYTKAGEHFAFFLADWAHSDEGPIFLVKDLILIPDSEVVVDASGWTITIPALTRVVNAAVNEKAALIEAHNHGGNVPRFSSMDRRGFKEFVPYILDSLRGRPYAATVWGDSTVYAEYFMPNGQHAAIRSVTASGGRLHQLVSRDDDLVVASEKYSRQLPWFTSNGQQRLARLRIAVVGLGGTGSHVVQQLAFLGARDFILIDHDVADGTSMNRLVTGHAADIETPKAILARRTIKQISPDAKVKAIQATLQSAEAITAIKGADVILGCVDNDGARLVLNEFSLAYRTPYFDVAVGIEANDGVLKEAGGRLAVVLPGGPCLNCMGLLDLEEVRYVLASSQERAFMVHRGYVRGIEINAPSVVALNGAVAAAAINEFSIYISGGRSVNPLTEMDMLGSGRSMKSQWMTPTKTRLKAGCPPCALAGSGDAAGLERRFAQVG